MASNQEYLCSKCGSIQHRDMLTVKKVLFTGMGEGAEITRSRVTEWLCVPCVKKDVDWNLPAYRTPASRLDDKVAVKVLGGETVGQ